MTIKRNFAYTCRKRNINVILINDNINAHLWDWIFYYDILLFHHTEQATDGTLASENWSLNMEICDMVNETEDGPKDAIKAIRKRLTQNAGKNYTVVMYTLTVLETCVKNCGRSFHILVCSKDFIQELVRFFFYTFSYFKVSYSRNFF